MKSVLISIQPYWVFLIIAKIMGWNIGKEKTVEVRKNYPKAENWNKVVKIYCSKDKRSFSKIPKEYQPLMERFLGKVIGEFVCDEIKKGVLTVSEYVDSVNIGSKETCLTIEEIKAYLGMKYVDVKGQHDFYGWHISDLVIYDTPKPLWDFMKCGAPTENELDEELCRYCEQTEWGERKCYGTPDGPIMCEGAFCGEAYDLYLDANFALKRPPQSWCYVEV